MGYSIYTIPSDSFQRMAESLRSQGLEVVEIPYRSSVADEARSESIDRPNVKRMIYRTKIHGVPIDLFCSIFEKSGPARVFARLAADGSIPGLEIAQLIDLAMVRIGATVQTIQRPFTQALHTVRKDWKKSLKICFTGIDPDKRYPEVALEVLTEAADRYRSIRTASLFWGVAVFLAFGGGLAIAYLFDLNNQGRVAKPDPSDLEFIPEIIIISASHIAELAFGCMFFVLPILLILAIWSCNRLNHFLCPRCGHYFIYSFMSNIPGSHCGKCGLNLVKYESKRQRRH